MKMTISLLTLDISEDTIYYTIQFAVEMIFRTNNYMTSFWSGDEGQALGSSDVPCSTGKNDNEIRRPEVVWYE